VKGALPKKATGGNVEGAKAIGKAIAERLIGQGVKHVVFDRNGKMVRKIVGFNPQIKLQLDEAVAQAVSSKTEQ